MTSISLRIAYELSISQKQVESAIKLLDEGSTVPFISRYRKEATGGLDDDQLRNLEERLGYLRDLEDRRSVILKNIEEQGKLSPELKKAILDADTKIRLEDLYLPYKQKRRTKGQVAIEAGIEALADSLLSNPQLDPAVEAAKYINTDEVFKEAFLDSKGVLEGARYILMERFAEDSGLVGKIRSFLQQKGKLQSKVVSGRELEGSKFRDYFDNSDYLGKIPSHRALAMFRGRKEGFLTLSLDVEHDENLKHPCEEMIASYFYIADKGRPGDDFMSTVVKYSWKVKLQTRLETELLSDLREKAEEEAIKVFALNLKDLLLASPAGQRAATGLDPGLRTGVKVAVIDATGQVVDHTTIYPHPPHRKWDESIDILAKLSSKYKASLIAIGNGTGSRETDRLCTELMKRHPETGIQKVMVNEAGASVYSASRTAAEELPDLDVTIRGAVSIARRLQDPLAELVKIDPKSIGVGQYQHDVNQTRLAEKLDAVVEDCVNHVGVEVNTASAALLHRVAGLNRTTAENIVEYRNVNGPFKKRKSLLKVPRLGAKAFEQAAGFLRIHNGDNPLDASAVHPESYSLVDEITKKTSLPLEKLIGNSAVLKSLRPSDFVNPRFGLPTVTDILKELDKPGRDPRPAFKTASLREGVETVNDLLPDMILDGTVTNVTNFGAFVDIGVHQDGLVHISMMADRFIKNPHEVVKTGDIVKVRVIEIDRDRNRIALSMRLDEKAPNKTYERPGSFSSNREFRGRSDSGQKKQRPEQGAYEKKPPKNNPFAAALANRINNKGKS